MNHSRIQAWNPTFPFILVRDTNEYIFWLCYRSNLQTESKRECIIDKIRLLLWLQHKVKQSNN